MKSKKSGKGSPRKKKKVFENVPGIDDAEIDPSYKMFLENLRFDGDTYVLDLPNGDHGKPVSVRYEEDAPCDHVTDKKDTELPNSSPNRRLGAPKGKRKGQASGRAPTGNMDQSSLPQTSSAKRKRKTEAKTPPMDESYERFLSLVKFKDGFMVIEPEPGVTIVYEQEEDNAARDNELRAGSSTKEPEPLISPIANKEDQQVLHTDAPDLNACKDDQVTPQHLMNICSDASTFDEKLSAILNQPYDQNEYEELWRRATIRRPVTRHRHLRSASKRYATEAIGLSYLDHYPDLAAQIDSADSSEKLSLLRKFFFWLKNLCHEGAYMPWISKPLVWDPISPDEHEPTPRGTPDEHEATPRDTPDEHGDS